MNENTETLTVHPKGDGVEIIVQHDQSGSAYGMELSKSAYDQLRLHFVSGSFAFAKYINSWYEYSDNTEDGDVYNNVVTGKLMTERQIYSEWIQKA